MTAPTTRRALLGALTTAPSFGVVPICSPWAQGFTKSYTSHRTHPPLIRTKLGRNLSRFRYHNAESFFRGVERHGVRHSTDQLYQTGIVLQLALSSHLLDVGFEDAWCARHIGLQLTKSLAYANATGLGLESIDIALLTAILSPYGKWRHAGLCDVPPDFPFPPHEIWTLTRALLDRVHAVTGHPRPHGWRQASRMRDA